MIIFYFAFCTWFPPLISQKFVACLFIEKETILPLVNEQPRGLPTVRLMNAPAQPRYRHSKLIQPTNESTYLNIPSLLYPPGPTLRLIFVSWVNTTVFVLPAPKFFFSSTLVHLHLVWISITSTSLSFPPHPLFPIFLCLTILISHIILLILTCTMASASVSILLRGLMPTHNGS